MNTFRLCLFSVLMLNSLSSISQKQKKADRLIQSNYSAHKARLASGDLRDKTPGSVGEKNTAAYIGSQFARYKFVPRGDSGTWMQSFTINDGKEIQPASYLDINGSKLVLFKEYFPFAFSANKKTEASVAIALAEDGVPWFVDLKDIAGDETPVKDLHAAIRAKSEKAASKGATALIIYNSSGDDISYQALDSSKPSSIPVLYISKAAFGRYFSDESAVIDIKLNVALREKQRKSGNVIGLANNGADSTVIATASLDHDNDVAALLELARLVKKASGKPRNYLFIVYSPEHGGKNGAEYFRQHPPIPLQKVNYVLSLDSLSRSANVDGLALVKQSMELMKNK